MTRCSRREPLFRLRRTAGVSRLFAKNNHFPSPRGTLEEVVGRISAAGRSLAALPGTGIAKHDSERRDGACPPPTHHPSDSRHESPDSRSRLPAPPRRIGSKPARPGRSPRLSRQRSTRRPRSSTAPSGRGSASQGTTAEPEHSHLRDGLVGVLLATMFFLGVFMDRAGWLPRPLDHEPATPPRPSRRSGRHGTSSTSTTSIRKASMTWT